MKMVAIWVLSGLALVVAGFALWVRLAPVDAARWHVDPRTATAPGAAGWLVRPEGGDDLWRDFDMDGPTLLAAFDRVAMATPRTTRIAGGVGEGRITYLTRSRLWGFPDYTTVAPVPYGNGSTLAVLGRARFGKSDTGVNRARIERWYGALRERLATTEPG